METDDGSGKQGEPILGLTEKDFEIYEDDKLVSQYESNQTVIPSPSLNIMSTVLLLDMSGSMLEAETLNELKTSAKLFVNRIAGDAGQEVAIYLFDGREKIKNLISFTKNIESLQNAIDSITKNKIVSDPGYDISTNLNGAVQQGLEILNDKSKNLKEGQLFAGTLVTFTDGTDQAGRVSDSKAAELVNSSSHSSFTVGLGAEVDESHLQALGKTGFVWSKSIEELKDAFTQIADDISNEAKKVYILGYCTPKRSGSHSVTIKVPGYSGSLSYSFDATGFEGGCDPLEIVPPTTTTTIPKTTTSTTIPSSPCPLALSLNNKQQLDTLRKLRDTWLKNSSSKNLISLYYTNAPEVSRILANNHGLNERLGALVRANMKNVEQLLLKGRVTINNQVIDNVTAYLKKLKEQGSPKLQIDINSVIKGVEERYLLNGIGVSVE